MEVDTERLWRDIEENATHGAVETTSGAGRTVLTGGEADRRVRERFVTRLREAGLEVRVDAVGNIAGRWLPESCDPDVAPVALGSHLDSVPRGGIFDGPLGTYGALEAVRTLQASEVNLRRPVDVVCFTEEEGARFGVGTLGSSVAAGLRDAETALTRTDETGTTLGERLDDIGFAGDDRIDANRWDTWLELHIEQGTKLIEAGAGVGIVDSITGITNCEVVITGEADHAGSTPMDERTDALAAAAEFILDLEETGTELAATGDAAVATAGRVSIEPNARNIVPGEVTLDLDIRDTDAATMTRMVDRCRESLTRLEQTRGVDTTLERYRGGEPTRLSEDSTDAAETAADRAGVDAIHLASGAMHDTATVAAVTDAGLLFAPSEGGFSHSPREWTDPADCGAATSVLAGAARLLASRSP